MNERLGQNLHKEKQLKEITQRLEILAQPVALFNSLDSKPLIEKITQLKDLSTEELGQDKKLLMQRLFDKPKYQDDQYHLLAHLFLTIRNDIPQDKFDEKRERKNIEGVLDLLTGNIPEKKTGRGKSSVVVPIETIFRCLWSNEKIVRVPSSPNKELLNEIIKNYESLRINFIKELPENQRIKVMKLTNYIVDHSKNTSTNDLFNDIFTQPPDIFFQSEQSKARAIFQTHNQTIFSSTERKLNNERVVTPPILFDEIQQLTDEHFISTTGRNNKRLKVHSENFVESSLGDDVTLFILHKLLFQKLSTDKKNFFYQGNQLSISKKGYRQINKIRHKLEHNSEPINDDLENIIESFVLPGFIFHKNERPQIVDIVFAQVKRFWKKLNSSPDLITENSKDPKSFFLESLAEDFVDVMGGIKKGKEYVVEKNETVVREAKRGITLPSHKYKKHVDFLIRVIDDKLSYQYQSSARQRYSFSFPTWLSYITAGRVQGLTANLFNPDLSGENQGRLNGVLRTLEKKVFSTHKGKLIGILETFTDGQAISDDELNNKNLPLPRPKIFSDMNILIDQLSKNDNEHNQDLIICYNDYLAQDIAGKFKDENIGIITSTTSEREGERIIRLFSQGKIKKIITSGKAGYGVNIIRPDKSFPDFHITIINPDSQTDINQGFGRLRGEKTENNFSLFLTDDFLLQLSTLFHEKKPLPLPYYHTAEQFQNLIEKYKKGENQEEFTKLFLELLKINKSKNQGDYVFQTELELNFEAKIAPVIREVKKNIIEKLIDDESTPLGRLVKDKFIEDEKGKFARKMVIKDLIDFFSLPEEDFLEMFSFDASLLQNNHRLAGNETALLTELVGNWYNKIVGSESEFRTFFEKSFNSEEYLRMEMTDFLRKRHAFYDKMSSLILDQLPFDSVDLKRVENIEITPLPHLIKDPFAPKLISVDDPNKFVPIDEDRYLIVIPDKKDHKQMFYVWEGNELPNKGDNVTIYGIDTQASGLKNEQKLKDDSSPIEGNFYFVFPTLANFKNKIVTHFLFLYGVKN